jgi:hypothetical protein
MSEKVKREEGNEDDLIYPITLDLFRDLVWANDEHIYEREATQRVVLSKMSSYLQWLHPNTMKLSKLVELNILSITVSLEKFQNASIMPRRPVQK